MMKMEEGEPMMAAHETELAVPGSFVVLQGMPGDGMANTIDSMPVLPKTPRGGANNNGSGADADDFTHVAANNSGTDLILQAAASLGSNNSTGAAPAAAVDESFVVVSDEEDRSKRQKKSDRTSSEKQHPKPTLSKGEERSMEKWSAKCRAQETRYRNEYISVLQQQQHQQHQSSSSSSTEMSANTSRSWWLDPETHKLLVFSQIPKSISETDSQSNVIGTLSPGAAVVGAELVVLDAATLKPVSGLSPSEDGVHARGQNGQIQVLKVITPMEGYVVLSVDGYGFMAPGVPSSFTDPRVWIWRVTCSAGAFVREGLELTSSHVRTLPYGSLLRVTRKTVNSMGLSRLRIHAILSDAGAGPNDDTSTSSNDEGARVVVEGWISELLNPLSGQRGHIARPVPFPVPAAYKVSLRDGAVIRSDVELSSPQIGLVPQGSLLTVTSRAFTDHPSDNCIQRLQLAGNGGWISVKLNFPPPQDEMVVEMATIEGTFDPDLPAMFHLDAQERVLVRDPTRAVYVDDDDDDDDERGSDENDDLDIDDDEGMTTNEDVSPPTSRRARKVKSQSQHRRDDKCLICLTNERNATIVHGETGHIACCLVCARILSASGERKCPVCRLPIDSVIQQFWA